MTGEDTPITSLVLEVEVRCTVRATVDLVAEWARWCGENPNVDPSDPSHRVVGPPDAFVEAIAEMVHDEAASDCAPMDGTAEVVDGVVFDIDLDVWEAVLDAAPPPRPTAQIVGQIDIFGQVVGFPGERVDGVP